MSAEKIREVRERSGAPLSEGKTALEEAQGDIDQALVVLQKRGTTRSVSESRIAAEGLVRSYIHPGDRLAVLVEVNCETDFVARSPDFRAFCDDVAMQIAGMSPRYVARTEIPEEHRVSQREIFVAQLREQKKPEAAIAKIVEGKINKWYSEVCLLDQESITVPGKTVEQVRAEVSAKFREKVSVRRFTRWEVGSGMEKRDSNLAHEVAKAIEGAALT